MTADAANQDTAPPAAGLSEGTLLFFERLLSMVQLNAGDPNFEVDAATVIVARKELAAALRDAEAG